MKEKTISNLLIGKTAYPKADFFQSVAIAYPEINIRWLLIGEGEMFLDERKNTSTMNEPLPNYKAKKELDQGQLSKLLNTIEQLSKLASAIPAIQSEIDTLKAKVKELENKNPGHK